MSILDTIVARTCEDLPRRKREMPAERLRERIDALPPPLPFASALRRLPGQKPRIIAEVKKASPSKGLIRADFQPAMLASRMAECGAAAISCLTEPHWFQGDLAYLDAIQARVSVPVLRKDFMVNPYQLLEARAHGASAALLIAATLESGQYADLLQAALDLDLDVLTEIHNERELAMVLPFNPAVIGVNSRDLKTFTVDLSVTARLLAEIPDDTVKIAESGIRTADDMNGLVAAGADAFLIGETLMRRDDPGAALAELLEGCDAP